MLSEQSRADSVGRGCLSRADTEGRIKNFYPTRFVGAGGLRYIYGGGGAAKGSISAYAPHMDQRPGAYAHTKKKEK